MCLWCRVQVKFSQSYPLVISGVSTSSSSSSSPSSPMGWTGRVGGGRGKGRAPGVPARPPISESESSALPGAAGGWPVGAVGSPGGLGAVGTAPRGGSTSAGGRSPTPGGGGPTGGPGCCPGCPWPSTQPMARYTDNQPSTSLDMVFWKRQEKLLQDCRSPHNFFLIQSSTKLHILRYPLTGKTCVRLSHGSLILLIYILFFIKPTWNPLSSDFFRLSVTTAG